jgi:hypothetical protein
VRLAEEAETQSMRDQEAALLARVQAAANDLSLDAVGAAFAKMGPPGQGSDADYASGMAKVFEAWRASLGPVRDDEARKRLQEAADSGVEATNRQDRKGIKQAYMTLKSEWTAYGARHSELAAIPVIAPVCGNWRDEVGQRLAGVGEQVKLESDRPETPTWEKQLDQALGVAGDLDSQDRLYRQSRRSGQGGLRRIESRISANIARCRHPDGGAARRGRAVRRCGERRLGREADYRTA